MVENWVFGFLDPVRFFLPDAPESLAVDIFEVTGVGSSLFHVIKGVPTRKTGLHQKRRHFGNLVFS